MADALKAVVLDFDGVVADSVDVKTRAFEAVFSNEAQEHVAAILAYHARHNGISRYEKFRWAYREVLRRPLTAAAEADLGERYNRLVEDAVVAAAWIPGAREFIASCPLPLFIASGTPETELRRIVDRRGLTRAFAGVHGAPTKKAPILRTVAGKVGAAAAELAMIGDAMTDYDAAREAGARFVGIVAPGRENPFPSGTHRLPDLARLAPLLGLAGARR